MQRLGDLRTTGAARSLTLLMFLALSLVLLACSPIQRFHGYAPDDTQLAEIQIGTDTRETVAEKLGRPSAGGVMEGSGWYYVQSDWEQNAWRAPVELRREVVAISFDGNDRVSNIERFGLQDGEVISLSRRVTASGPGRATFIRQLLGNIGQFSPAMLGR